MGFVLLLLQGVWVNSDNKLWCFERFCVFLIYYDSYAQVLCLRERSQSVFLEAQIISHSAMFMGIVFVILPEK